MTTPDINLLKDMIGLAPSEDFPWVHELRFVSHPHRGTRACWCPVLTDSNHSVSLKWLRSLLRLSRLDRKIDQRKTP